MAMKCPYCSFHFNVLFLNADDEVPRSFPVICQCCIEVSFFVDGQIRALTTSELASIQSRPEWDAIIQPLRTKAARVRQAKNAVNN